MLLVDFSSLLLMIIYHINWSVADLKLSYNVSNLNFFVKCYPFMKLLPNMLDWQNIWDEWVKTKVNVFTVRLFLRHKNRGVWHFHVLSNKLIFYDSIKLQNS